MAVSDPETWGFLTNDHHASRIGSIDAIPEEVKSQWGEEPLTLELIGKMMHGTVEPFLSFLPKSRTEPRHPSFKWLGFFLHIFSIFLMNVVAIPWWEDVRIDKRASSAANNGFIEDSLTLGIPSWALTYLICLFVCDCFFLFATAFIWRCEDDPAIIEKYGDHSQDFKPQKKIVESENPAFENEGNTEKTQDKSGKAIAILSDTDRATSEDLDGEVTSNANVAPADI
jgi:hypothetical protein